MKRLSAIVAGGILAASLVAQAQTPVYSVNAVGYTKVNLPAGFSMVSLPFNSVGGAAMSIDDALGKNFADGTTIFFYMGAAIGYQSYTYYDNGPTDPTTGWYNNSTSLMEGTNKILRGEGFWIQVTSATNVVLAGEVPGGTDATNSIPLVKGFQMVSSAYPAAMSVKNGLTPSDGDTIFNWTGAAYKSYTYYDNGPTDPTTGWYDNDTSLQVADVSLAIGQAAWYQSVNNANVNWNQTKPYQWP